jgi:DNA primase
MKYDRLEFLDAVDELAKRVGMEIPRDTRAAQRPIPRRATCTARWTRRPRSSAANWRSEKALAYRREAAASTAEIVERYGLGYAPDGFSALRDALGSDPGRMQLLERKAGMFSKNDRGNVYDKFRDRLMFPIHDRRGRTIAFGGRVIDPEDSPKYLNSPETALFHKGRELYGLWQARQANAKLERLIVVEGYMDVVALAQHGWTQAVATLGTATTPDHAELLFRNAPDVVFCFDGDRAGSQRRVEGAGIGAAADEGRPPGLLPVPARWRGSGHDGAQGRRGRLRCAPARCQAAVWSSSMHPTEKDEWRQLARELAP